MNAVGVLVALDIGHEALMQGRSTMWTARDVGAMRASVCGLIEATNRTVSAFEALGKANGVIPSLEAHRECEAALVAQKEALVRVHPMTREQQAEQAGVRG